MPPMSARRYHSYGNLPVEDPFDSYGNSIYINYLMSYLDDDQWLEYIESDNGIIYSCNLATYMGIIPLTY